MDKFSLVVILIKSLPVLGRQTLSVDSYGLCSGCSVSLHEGSLGQHGEIHRGVQDGQRCAGLGLDGVEAAVGVAVLNNDHPSGVLADNVDATLVGVGGDVAALVLLEENADDGQVGFLAESYHLLKTCNFVIDGDTGGAQTLIGGADNADQAGVGQILEVFSHGLVTAGFGLVEEVSVEGDGASLSAQKTCHLAARALTGVGDQERGVEDEGSVAADGSESRTHTTEQSNQENKAYQFTHFFVPPFIGIFIINKVFAYVNQKIQF